MKQTLEGQYKRSMKLRIGFSKDKQNLLIFNKTNYKNIQINKITNDKEYISTYFTVIQKNHKNYNEQLYTSKLDKWEDMEES